MGIEKESQTWDQQSEAPPEVSLIGDRRTEESYHRQGKLGDSQLGSEAVVESTGQIGLLEDGLFPTTENVNNATNALTLVTYAALQRPTIHVITTQLANGACSIFMSIHLDERKSAVRLKSGLLHVSEALE